jgi:hypothetical protein
MVLISGKKRVIESIFHEEGTQRESDIAQYRVIVEQNVTWGDMDTNGHVNNVEYFRYTENASVGYCRDCIAILHWPFNYC